MSTVNPQPQSTIFQPKPYDPGHGHSDSCHSHSNHSDSCHSHNNSCHYHTDYCHTYYDHNDSCHTHSNHNNSCYIPPTHNDSCHTYNDHSDSCYTQPPPTHSDSCHVHNNTAPPPQTGNAVISGRVGNNAADLKFKKTKNEAKLTGNVGKHNLNLNEEKISALTTNVKGEVVNPKSTDKVNLTYYSGLVRGNIGEMNVELTLENKKLTGRIGDQEINVEIKKSTDGRAVWIEGNVKSNSVNHAVKLTAKSEEGGADPSLILIPALAYPKFQNRLH